MGLFLIPDLNKYPIFSKIYLMSKPKYHLITLGCQMNKSDSERLAAVLEKAGWKIGSDGFREKKLKNAKSTTRLEFVLTTTDWPELTQVASALKSDWEKIGVKVSYYIKLTIPCLNSFT